MKKMIILKEKIPKDNLQGLKKIPRTFYLPKNDL